MRDLAVLFLHLLATVGRLAVAGGTRAVVAPSDPGQHTWSNLFVVVEGEHEVRPAVTRERSVRFRLSLDGPADAEKGCQNLSSLGSRPGGHAALKVTFRRSGGASSFSKRSAITRSASA